MCGALCEVISGGSQLARIKAGVVGALPFTAAKLPMLSAHLSF
jgi:hypothetical protein